MRTIQMTLDDELVESVDEIVKELQTTRSAFTRDALRSAVKYLNIKKQEEKHKKGYEMYPIKSDEFDIWEEEQNWGDI